MMNNGLGIAVLLMVGAVTNAAEELPPNVSNASCRVVINGIGVGSGAFVGDNTFKISAHLFEVGRDWKSAQIYCPYGVKHDFSRLDFLALGKIGPFFSFPKNTSQAIAQDWALVPVFRAYASPKNTIPLMKPEDFTFALKSNRCKALGGSGRIISYPDKKALDALAKRVVAEVQKDLLSQADHTSDEFKRLEAEYSELEAKYQQTTDLEERVHLMGKLIELVKKQQEAAQQGLSESLKFTLKAMDGDEMMKHVGEAVSKLVTFKNPPDRFREIPLIYRMDANLVSAHNNPRVLPFWSECGSMGHGDSGGSVVCPSPDGQYRVVGTISGEFGVKHNKNPNKEVSPKIMLNGKKYCAAAISSTRDLSLTVESMPDPLISGGRVIAYCKQHLKDPKLAEDSVSQDCKQRFPFLLTDAEPGNESH